MSPLLNSRIIQLSTSHIGGAGIAARRLNMGLREMGVRSEFYALAQPGYTRNAYEYEIERDFLEKSRSALSATIQNHVSDKTFFSSFSTSAFKLDKLNNWELINPTDTVFHIHNHFNLINSKNIRALLENKFKIVFTLHDQRLMTAGCHYAFDCRGFESSCRKCPQVSQFLRSYIHENQKNFLFLEDYRDSVTLIAPSKWIAEEAAKSRILGKLSINHISNIPEKVALKHPGNSTRKAISFPIRIGIASMEPFSYIKGGALVRALSEAQPSSVQILYMRDFNEKEQKEIFWSSVDYLMTPSVVDNSPNVIHEAKLRGIPVIATKTGGILELLDRDFDIQISLDMPIINLINVILDHRMKLETNYQILQQESFNSYMKYIQNPTLAHIELYKSLIL